MPLFGTFSSGSSRALGLRNGSPPLPPTITSPTDNQSLTGSGNQINRINTTINFTSTVTSFAIDRFEYKLDRLNSSDVVVVEGTWQTAASAGATSFLISGLLTSTKYGLYMRTVDLAGLTSDATSRIRFTTAAEVSPTAPTPSLSSTALSVSITYNAGTDGTYTIGTREYSLHPTSGGTPTYVSFTGNVTRTTRTDGGAALVPGTNYTVAFRYTASSPGAGTSTASSTISTSAEVAPGAPGATLTTDSTTQLTVTRNNSTAGTYAISGYFYRYYTKDGNGNWTPSGTWISMPNSTAPITGLSVDTEYRCQVKAVASISGTETISTSGTAQTNPNTPSAPSIGFTGMSSSSYGTATITVSKPDYATRAFVEIIGVGTYNSVDHPGNFSGTGPWTFTIGGQAHNSTYNYRAYVRNRIAGESTYGNTITWYTPKKNQQKIWRGSDYGQAYYFPDYTYVIPTNACEPSRLGYTFGPSGIAATEDEVGYARVDYMQATFTCGIQLYRPSDGSAFQQQTNTNPLTAICNTSNLRFSYATVGSEGTQSAARPTDVFGGTGNLGGATTLYRFGVSVGGTDLHNKVFFATATVGKGWNAGCVLSLKGDYWAGKLLELVGVETTPGSAPGYF